MYSNLFHHEHMGSLIQRVCFYSQPSEVPDLRPSLERASTEPRSPRDADAPVTLGLHVTRPGFLTVRSVLQCSKERTVNIDWRFER